MNSQSLPHTQPVWRAFAARLARKLAILVLICLGLAGTAMAQKSLNPTRGEMALLPPYCPDTQGFAYGDASYNTSPRAAYWIRLMDAKSFWALHHYCWALIKIRRADAVGVEPVVRNGMLLGALADYDYVLENGSPDFVLLPELLTRRSELQIRLGQYGQGLQSIEWAIQRKADYWPAYVSWANFLLSQKRTKEALAFLERGLTQSPDAPKLRATYKKAGGDPDAFVRKLPPRPVAAPAAPASAPASAADMPASAASEAR